VDEIVWLDQVEDADRWAIDETRFRIGDVAYVTTMRHRATTDRLCVKKPPALIERIVELLAAFRHANIVELGISQGGSTALVAQIAEPRKLVAVELDPEPVEPLERYIDSTGQRDRIRPHYGVDQADRRRQEAILDEEFGDEPLDLVIDDASHLLAETRTSFEVLFPRLRPGGLFIIEDWNWEHLRAEVIHERARQPGTAANAAIATRLREMRDGAPSRARPTPLTILVMELLLCRAWSGDVVADLHATDMWVLVRRGPAVLDRTGFRVADYTHDRFGLLPGVAQLDE
jgi:predicted O-methyltransferase YrrM